MSIQKKILLSASVVLTMILFISCGKTSDAKKNEAQDDPVSLINSGQEFQKIIDSTKETLMVFDLYADWCGPCRLLAPMFREMAVTHGEKVKFFRINVDKTPEIASSLGTQGIPYVVFMRNGEQVHALMGLNPREAYERVIGACGSVGSNDDCRKNLESSL
jgi:thioredoxin 1